LNADSLHFLRSGAIACLTAVSLLRVSAGTSVWDGGGLDGMWGIPDNWSGDTLPVFDNQTDLVFLAADRRASGELMTVCLTAKDTCN
jgi:hypothetical protein